MQKNGSVSLSSWNRIKSVIAKRGIPIIRCVMIGMKCVCRISGSPVRSFSWSPLSLSPSRMQIQMMKLLILIHSSSSFPLFVIFSLILLMSFDELNRWRRGGWGEDISPIIPLHLLRRFPSFGRSFFFTIVRVGNSSHLFPFFPFGREGHLITANNARPGHKMTKRPSEILLWWGGCHLKGTAEKDQPNQDRRRNEMYDYQPDIPTDLWILESQPLELTASRS